MSPLDEHGNYVPADVTLVAGSVSSAARTATGTGSSFQTVNTDSIEGFLAVTAVSASTSPTLDVRLETSLDAGSTWSTVGSFAQATGVTTKNKVFGPLGDSCRWGWTLGGSSIAATMTTALAGANNDMTYTADVAGSGGNSITVRYVDPAAISQALGVVVVGNAITVNLATDGAGAITSTAAQVKSAIDGSAPAAALVDVANAGGNSGAGVVTAMAATALSGGVTNSFTFSVAAEANN
jgi:hypothetical protein